MGGVAKSGTGRGSSPVPRASLSDNLTRRIVDMIRSEGLKPGDHLPAVKSLAESFSVAPPTLREALRRLQASGVVELRHGSGVYVRRGFERIFLANPGLGEIEPRTVLDLLETRLLMEPHLAGMTTRRAGKRELAGLEQHLREAENYLEGNDEMLHHTNMGFHQDIANFSGNPVAAQVIESLIELYSFEQLVIISFYNDRPQDHEEHLEIFAAIRAGDDERARELMYEHIRGVKSVVQARLEER
jgi:GntR family transcriptional repressor for pyruvate dehydrogenase complex